MQTKLDNLPETINWLDSENYLVTENTVERIIPQTSCEAFKQQFSKPITVFKDNNEISTGLIGTGMKVQTETEKNTYLISVLADISGDGESNTIDLTKVIRYVLNSKEWDLSDIQQKSADINVDGKISEQDVIANVKYIVYGILEAPDFEPVEQPTINIIDGNYSEEDKCYTSKVIIEIEPNEETIKTFVKIENSEEIAEYAEYNTGDKLTVTNNGAYKISAYSVGKLGNRSNITTTIFAKETKGTASVEIEGWGYGEQPKEPIITSTTNPIDDATIIYTGTTSTGETYGPTEEPPTEVGDYTVTVIIPETEEFAEIEETDDFSITPKTLEDSNVEITLNQEQVVYTGTELKPGITIVVDGQTLVEGKDFSLEYKDNIDAGIATIIITGKGNYEGELETTFEIEKAELIATYEGEIITYGQNPELAVKVEGFVNSETAVTAKEYVAPTIINANTSVGEHEETPQGGSAKNYFFTYESGNLIINKAEGEVSVIINEWQYGDNPNEPEVLSNTNDAQQATFIYEGTTIDNEKYGPTEELPTEIGEYTVTTTIPATDNYNEIVTTTNFKVNKRKIKGSIIVEDKVYDGKTTVNITALLNGIVETDELQMSATRQVKFNDAEVGNNKQVSSTFTLIGNDAYKYELENEAITGTGNILPAELTATYEGETITYGQNPELAVKVEGFVNGETAETAGGFSIPTIFNSNISVGEYNLTPEGGSAKNYSFTYVSGVLKIQPKSFENAKVEITLDEEQVVYTGLEQKPGITIVVDGETLVEGEDFTVEYVDNIDAGTATIMITGKGDYEGELEKTFEIKQAELKATYEGETITYGETPELAVKVEGFVNGETASTATNYVVPTIINTNTAVGKYDLTPSGGSAKNYYFTYVPGKLVILKYEGTASVSIDNWKYGESARTPIVESETNGTDNVTYAYSGTTLNNEQYGPSENPPTEAGEYTITATFAETENYRELLKTANFAVQPATLVGNIIADNKEYDGTTTASASIQLTGILNNDDVEIVENIAPTFENANVGTNKTVTGKYVLVGSKASNYILESETLTAEANITPATLIAKYVGETIGFGETAKLEVIVTGFVNGETAETASGFSMPSISNSNTAVGEYNLTPQGGNADNYEFTYESGTLIIETVYDYKVQYYVETADGEYNINEEITLQGIKNRTVTAPEKTIQGYELDENNVNNIETGVITTDGKLELKLYYNAITYFITYNLNGGTVSEENVTEYKIYSEDITLINPTKNCCTFSGWTGTDINTPQQTVTISKGSIGNREYAANWEQYKYTIKFNGNGSTSGAMADMQNIEYYSEIALTPNAYQRTECNFIGWNTSADGTGTSYSNNETIQGLSAENGGIVTLYAQWEDVVKPIWDCTNITNTNTDYKNYASSKHTITITFEGTDANYVSENLSVEDIEVYVGNTLTTPGTKTLSASTTIENGISYTLTLSGIAGDGALSILIPENTIKDEWNNQNEEAILSVGITIDNTAPNSPQIAMTANGGLHSEEYYYQNSATYTITSGEDNNSTVASTYSLDNMTAWSANALSSEDTTIAKNTYTVSGQVNVGETTYLAPVNVAPSAASGACTITAYTYDKAGNKSAGASVTDNICGNHNKGIDTQKTAETCTAAEVREYRCTDCYIANGTYNGKAALGHYYPCSGTNHKRSGGSVTITCSRCTATKKYSITNGTCTSWSCSCGASGGVNKHASGSYSYSDATYHAYKCSRCSGTVVAKHVHSKYTASGNYHYHYCGTCSHTYGSGISHTMAWSKTSTSHSWKCGTCGYTTTAGNHVFTTYTGYKKCNTCGYTTGI